MVNRAARAAVAAALLIAMGVLLGWAMSRVDTSTVPEIAAPAKVQSDGSLVIERSAQAPDTKPAQQIPSGSKLERVVKVTVKPKASPVLNSAGTLESAAATVDLSLVRLTDQTRRVVASSPDGEIVGGIDIPVEPVVRPEPKRWAVGLYVNPASPVESGVFIDRDLGRLRVGVELGRSARNEPEARVKFGFTF